MGYFIVCCCGCCWLRIRNEFRSSKLFVNTRLEPMVGAATELKLGFIMLLWLLLLLLVVVVCESALASLWVLLLLFLLLWWWWWWLWWFLDEVDEDEVETNERVGEIDWWLSRSKSRLADLSAWRCSALTLGLLLDVWWLPAKLTKERIMWV